MTQHDGRGVILTKEINDDKKKQSPRRGQRNIKHTY